jgi:hypothetical protein
MAWRVEFGLRITESSVFAFPTMMIRRIYVDSGVLGTSFTVDLPAALAPND